MGNIQKRSGLSASRGSGSCRSPGMLAGHLEPSVTTKQQATVEWRLQQVGVCAEGMKVLSGVVEDACCAACHACVADDVGQ